MAQRITRARPGHGRNASGHPPSLARRWRVKLGHLHRFNNRPPGCRASRRPNPGGFALLDFAGSALSRRTAGWTRMSSRSSARMAWGRTGRVITGRIVW